MTLSSPVPLAVKWFRETVDSGRDSGNLVDPAEPHPAEPHPAEPRPDEAHPVDVAPGPARSSSPVVLNQHIFNVLDESTGRCSRPHNGDSSEAAAPVAPAAGPAVFDFGTPLTSGEEEMLEDESPAGPKTRAARGKKKENELKGLLPALRAVAGKSFTAHQAAAAAAKYQPVEQWCWAALPVRVQR